MMFLSKFKTIAGTLLLAGIVDGTIAPLVLAQLPAASKAAETNRPQATSGKAQINSDELLKTAAHIVKDIKDEDVKARTLAQLAMAQSRCGQRSNSIKTFAQAVAVANAIVNDDADIKRIALRDIAFAQAQVGMAEEAVQTAREITTDPKNEQRDYAFWGIAKALADNRDFKGALKVTELNSAAMALQPLTKIVGPMAAAGEAKWALELAEKQQGSFRVWLYSDIASALFRSGRQSEAKQVIESALKYADTINDDSEKASALREIANAQRELDDEAGAQKTADRSKLTPKEREAFVCEIACHRARVGKIDAAHKTLELLDENDRNLVLREISVAQARSGDFAAARKTIAKVPGNKRDTLVKLASLTRKAGDQIAATSLSREALANEEGWHGGSTDDCDTLRLIVLIWAEGGGEQDALAWANAQKSPFVKAFTLAVIVEGVAKRLERESKPAK